MVLQRLLLPPLGEKGPAKKVRVCNACLRNSEVSCGLLSAPFALWRRGRGWDGGAVCGGLLLGARPPGCLSYPCRRAARSLF